MGNCKSMNGRGSEDSVFSDGGRSQNKIGLWRRLKKRLTRKSSKRMSKCAVTRDIEEEEKRCCSSNPHTATTPSFVDDGEMPSASNYKGYECEDVLTTTETSSCRTRTSYSTLLHQAEGNICTASALYSLSYTDNDVESDKVVRSTNFILDPVCQAQYTPLAPLSSGALLPEEDTRTKKHVTWGNGTKPPCNYEVIKKYNFMIVVATLIHAGYNPPINPRCPGPYVLVKYLLAKQFIRNLQKRGHHQAMDSRHYKSLAWTHPHAIESSPIESMDVSNTTLISNTVGTYTVDIPRLPLFNCATCRYNDHDITMDQLSASSYCSSSSRSSIQQKRRRWFLFGCLSCANAESEYDEEVESSPSSLADMNALTQSRGAFNMSGHDDSFSTDLTNSIWSFSLEDFS